jgi:hypothetical protein
MKCRVNENTPVAYCPVEKHEQSQALNLRYFIYRNDCVSIILQCVLKSVEIYFKPKVRKRIRYFIVFFATLQVSLYTIIRQQ